MARKQIDCRDYPSESKCSIMISGEEEEVVRTASEHAVSVHGEKDSPELRNQIRSILKDEPMTAAGLTAKPSKTTFESDQANSFTG